MRLLPKNQGQLGWTPYAWLIYLCFQFFQPIVSQDPFDWLVVLSSVAVFLPLYFRGFWSQGRQLLPIIAGITLIGLVTAPLNSGSTCYFVYAAAFAGGAGPPRVAVKIILGIVALILLEGQWPGIPYFGWISGSIFSALIGGVNIHQAEQKRANERLRLAQSEVERLATLAERERIARDLHDLLGHTLSTITLKAELAQRLLPSNSQKAESEMADVEAISRDALSEVRKAVENYRHARIGPELAKAKVALAAAAVTLEIESGPFDLEPEVENDVALALREAITNVIRHARASRCTIRLHQAQGRFSLTVEDDGRGLLMKEGNGLAGIRERIEGLGGTVELSSHRQPKARTAASSTKGTRLVLALPTRTGFSDQAASFA